MLTLALFFAAQAAPVAAPRPGPIKAFGAWVAACDNTRYCEMTSIWPEDSLPDGSPYEAMSVSIDRAPGPAGGWTVEIQLPANGGNDTLRVTTERGLDVRGKPSKDLLRFAGADAARIVAGMIEGADLRVGDETSVMGMASLKGSSAALRFIDAEQGRAGTVTAAVAKGAKPASAVPGPRPAPQIGFVRPAGAAAAFTPAMRKALDKSSECGSVYEGGTGELPQAEVVALGGGKTLVLLPCGSGAYNYSTEPYILSAGAKPVLAKFDSPVGFSEADDGKPSLVNADFDARTGRLESYSKGRGLGDCGSAEAFVWDGAVFRLVEARSMPECRGSVNWLTTWRAQAVAK
ncbi:DUF1176 domain-containing protein [Sphingomonas sp. MG17]|uniref:DUF1176 domain-containing protein n=1 Tax=Sphingomonas tagetis TaxID=2949092 RepID=A0A9X2HNC8_9SPHN|nr:DUF1176 domain-containing protein [Sphingomonas tagetis]MCP3730503.1 DUF1176 domain-containing protein [Sphingomonas tagetis]